MGMTRGEEMTSRTGVQLFWEVYMGRMGYVQGGQIHLWASTIRTCADFATDVG